VMYDNTAELVPFQARPPLFSNQVLGQNGLSRCRPNDRMLGI
jgi:hypothetical protein